MYINDTIIVYEEVQVLKRKFLLHLIQLQYLWVWWYEKQDCI